MAHVGSKTRSLAQIQEKHCVHSKGHNFGPILKKFGQNYCLDKISDEVKNCDHFFFAGGHIEGTEEDFRLLY